MPTTALNRRDFLTLAAGTCTAAATHAKPADKHAPLAFTRNIPTHKPYDVVVCGAGPAGTAAALAARRAGLTVLLIEAQGQLGGMGTSGLVSHWLGGRTADCKKWIVGGIFREIAQQAAKQNAALIPPRGPKYQPHGWLGHLAHGIPFDPYAVAAILDDMTRNASIDLLLFTNAVDVTVQHNRITHVIIFNKSGLAAVPASAVIDATGDADIAARSGCPTTKGRDSDNLMTPATLQFHVYNVDQDALAQYIRSHDAPRFREKIRQLRKTDDWPFPYDIFISVQLHDKGVMMINTSRIVGVDGTDGASVTDGMIRGRDETRRLLAVLRKHFPGLQNARIKSVAPLLGVRETRRIRGPFTLTVKHLLDAADFDDTVGLSSYGWDLPDPKRPSHQPLHKKAYRKREITPIPYRIMLPDPIENLICPGRRVNVERHVLGPLRVSAPCFAMGQAAGQAAKQVIQNKTPYQSVNVKTLRSQLQAAGTILTPS